MARSTLREHALMLRSQHHPTPPAPPIPARAQSPDHWHDQHRRAAPKKPLTGGCPGHWEGDLIIGTHGRTTRFVTILALSKEKAEKDPAGVCDA